MENGDQHRLKINARGNLEINAKLTAGIFIEYNLINYIIAHMICLYHLGYMVCNVSISDRVTREFTTNARLANLELTDLSERYRINVCPVHVVTFSQLEELYIVKNALRNWMKMENPFLVYWVQNTYPIATLLLEQWLRVRLTVH